jgi:hypothetical protein
MSPRTSASGYSTGDVTFILLIVAACSAMTLFRLIHIHDAADLLVADDACTFMLQANSEGVLSLLLHYSGYFHLVVRSIAYAASAFDITEQPLFFAASVMVLYALSWVLVAVTLLSLDIPKTPTFLACVLLAVQPVHQDVFFNLNHTQWATGLAMMVFALGYQGTVSRPIAAVVGLLFGLQGPFSILVFPLLVARRLLTRDDRIDPLLFFVGLAALLQVMSLLTNPRELFDGSDVIPLNAGWILTVVGTLTRGMLYNLADPLTVVFLAACVPLAVFGVVQSLRGGTGGCSPTDLRVFLLLMAAVAVTLLSALHTLHSIPQWLFQERLASLMENNRYLFIPHSLLIIGMPILLHRCRRLAYLCIAGFAWISFAGFAFAERFPTHFNSYVNMGRFMDTDAAVNPAYATANGPLTLWLYPFRRDSYRPLPEDRVIPVDLAKSDAASGIRETSDKLHVNIPVTCRDSADVGIKATLWSANQVEVEAQLQNAGNTYTAFRGYRDFSRPNIRYKDRPNPYAGDRIPVDLAFPYPGEGTTLTFSAAAFRGAAPSSGESKTPAVSLGDLTIFCLPPYEPER